MSKLSVTSGASGPALRLGSGGAGPAFRVKGAAPATRETPLTFEAAPYNSGLVSVILACSNGAAAPAEVWVSLDDGKQWDTYEATPEGVYLAQLAPGKRMQVRAYMEQSTDGDNDSTNGSFYVANGDVYVYGNFMSLVDGDDYATLDTVGPYQFYELFNSEFSQPSSINSGQILSHPTQQMFLPAVNLATSCYQMMFQQTQIEVAPELPAQTLAAFCYERMFVDCKFLKESPILPASELVNSCYRGMFSGCASLESVTCHALTQGTAREVITNWLNGVNDTGTLYVPRTTTIYFRSYTPSGWQTQYF